MATFTAWKFDRPDGADQAAAILKQAQQDGLVDVLDHAVVSWPTGASQPKLHHSHDHAVRDTGWGAFWGLLFGAMFLIPVLGVAIGAGLGAWHNSLQGVGLTKQDLETIKSEVVEGTSALLAFTDKGDLDRVAERFHGMSWKLVDSNLTDAERRLLVETMGG